MLGRLRAHRYVSPFFSFSGASGGLLFLAMVIAALAAPLLFGPSDQQSIDSFAPASWLHVFGTDEVGRDVLTRGIYGLGVSLSLACVGVPIGAILGTLMGVSGILSDRLGQFFQRVCDVILGFPSVVLGMCIVIVLGVGWLSLVITIALFTIPYFARQTNGAFLIERDREYVLAARVMGVKKHQLMLRHILPNIVDPLIVQFPISLMAGVFLEASLSVVGLGLQPPTPSLGTMVNVSVRYVWNQPYYMVCPILLFLVLTLALNAIADAFNSSLRGGNQ
jgi:peptide/nickel transport system permease protein